MSIDVTGIGAGATAVEGIIGTIGAIIDRFIPDKAEAAKAAEAIQAELVKQMGEQNTGQIEINKVEAASPNLFVSGWRPFIGWVCGASLVWQYIALPLFYYVAQLCGSTIQPPALAVGDLIMLTVNMLGLGAMHSFDKYNGTTAPAVPVITTREVRKALPVK